MSLNMEILRLLTEGPKSVKELCELTGKTNKQIGSALSWLASKESISSEPVRYNITDDGKSRAAWKPKTSKLTLQRQRRYAEKKAKQVVTERRHASVARSAIANIHPIAAAWSAHG